MSKLSLSASLLLCCALYGCSTGDTNDKTTEDPTDATDTGAGDTDDGADDTDADDTDDTDAGDTDASDSGATDSGSGDTDSGSGDTGSAGGDTGSGGGTDTGSASGITGTYGADAILPVQAAYWIGQPGDPTESNGGPFLYLFSAPVSCDEISVASWLDTIPAGTQVMEMIVGTTTPGTAVPVAHSAGADKAEVNYVIAGGGSETRATDGTVTLTNLADGVSVDGSLDVTFPDGTATGTFHATWCATGQEF